ncbi:MAG: carboxypeptidase-like regulatory domain-containing protein [Bacteroidales bacterium]|nr:carboxypeptidase-like regulatory domain-containing protein [Bacteroidales bacterium]
MKSTCGYLTMFWLFIVGYSATFTAVAQEPVEAMKTEFTVSGVVRDKENRKKLENVAVSLVGTPIGTVTNAEGVFSLKIPHMDTIPQLELSHIGYMNARFSASAPEGSNNMHATILMIPIALQLNEVVAYGNSARRIVEEALERIPKNYPSDESMTSAFYRETVQKGHRYISISEAMLDVYKTSYKQRTSDCDKVQIDKARRLLSQKQSDTLGVKVVGGPNLPLFMDVVKNAYALFDEETLDYYSFVQEPSVFIDDRLQYVISFRPRVKLDYALYVGRVFIDREHLAFTRAEFELDLSDRERAIAAILYKKPLGLRFRPLKVSFLITYRQHDGVTCLNYICNEMCFKCDWKRRLFSSSYVARSEMVAVDREEHPERVIARRDAFKPYQVFYDIVKEYWSEDFWKDYNIIEPTESLEDAVKKLRKQM